MEMQATSGKELGWDFLVEGQQAHRKGQETVIHWSMKDSSDGWMGSGVDEQVDRSEKGLVGPHREVVWMDEYRLGNISRIYSFPAHCAVWL